MTRLDLPNKTIVFAVVLTFVLLLLISGIPNLPSPGSVVGQSAAALGAICLFVPFLFSLFKRSGLIASPPSWFVAHIIFALLGALFIAVHVRAGDWFTPPGFVLLCLLLLLIQGTVLRVVLSKRLSLLFAQSSQSQGFFTPSKCQKETLQQIINDKIKLLKSLDARQNEALFSPALKHWFWHPIKSTQYQLLADKEARLIGIRQAAGKVLSLSRRVHLLIAALFFIGLLSHIIVMLFFAGYAAQGGDIEWWYITAWGG